jgi:hypothetical protein
MVYFRNTGGTPAGTPQLPPSRFTLYRGGPAIAVLRRRALAESNVSGGA